MAGTILLESEVFGAVELILVEGASLCLLAFGAKLAPLPLLCIEEDAFVGLDERNAPESVSNKRFIYEGKHLSKTSKKTKFKDMQQLVVDREKKKAYICRNAYVAIERKNLVYILCIDIDICINTCIHTCVNKYMHIHPQNAYPDLPVSLQSPTVLLFAKLFFVPTIVVSIDRVALHSVPLIVPATTQLPSQGSSHLRLRAWPKQSSTDSVDL
jgi:hypothetical protein